ncbi:AraC family transcriptional regulator [Myroides albus]|uniref:helix-turn-helix domain-containing protein n=1 Tax=Myroides albus TaxID=2562892 RepID=UPI002159B068|nr:AraC family transcriptional regulator [Myroides albus]UVD79106.1 AraC family transcriptional regulator [Myroides albus]
MQNGFIYDLAKNLEVFLNALKEHFLLVDQNKEFDLFNEFFNKFLLFCSRKKYFGLTPDFFFDKDNRACLLLTQENLCASREFSLKAKRTLGIDSSFIAKYLNKEFSSFIISGLEAKVFKYLVINKGKTQVLLIGVFLKEQCFLSVLRIKQAKKLRLNSLHSAYRVNYYQNHYKRFCQLKSDTYLKITLSEYVNLNKLQKRTFQRNFKKFMGVSFYNYHMQQRLLKGLYLIMFSDYLISEIAYRCDFNSYKNFVRAFSHGHNLRASDFRIL